ncbi:BAR domain-containing protein [Azospirillum isscasi]|uniref:hypothetical protein n=1 Tax=Azospirillum isscasi TaxID=3053926 RepID=UPI0027D290DD|nr:hypothetical protein [Azospirillum isscasi]
MGFAVTEKKLTTTELEARISAAREREKRARNAAARLQRQLVTVDRKLAAQQKIVLGAALLRLAQASPERVDGLRRLVLPHVARPGDRACLAGTPFAPGENDGGAA